jgi:putative membrane protein
MMWWDDGGGSAAMWIMMSIGMVVVWGGLIALVAWLVHISRSGGVTSPPAPPAPRAMDADEVLAERFARGEIEEEEFTHRRAVLHSR